MSTQNRKVIVVGLPGLPINAVDTDIFTTIKELKDTGVYGTLQPIFPLVSPSIWASLITGTYPRKHGIIEYCVVDSNGVKKNLTPKDLRKPPIWKLLNAYNLKTGVVNVPFTYPPEPINGFIISGYVASHERIATYPYDLINLLDKRFRIREMYKNIKWYRPYRDLEFLNSMIEITKKESEILMYLIKNFEWHFLITSFFFVEEVHHYLWKYLDSTYPKFHNDNGQKSIIINRIYDFYNLIDATIKKIMDNADDNTTIFIVTPYEIGPLNGTIFLNHVLHKLGLLSFKRSITTSLKRILYGKIRLPDKFLRLLYDRLPRLRLNLSDIDYNTSLAYSSGWIGQIYINRKIIRNEVDYNNLVKYISFHLINELKDPVTHEPIIEKIVLKKDLIPDLEYGPDIYVIPKDYKYVAYGCGAAGDDSLSDFGPKLHEYIMYPPYNYQTGWHKMSGFLIAKGPFFKNRYRSNVSISLVDIVPTILHIFDKPIPDWIDGRVLIEFFK
ncbi:alkaline phosphatase family protein [Vulcanisaeta thermophila]|uniref:alkaline phosphatase family protein n=1 Tax=Vulcanisaeta thermophila TaxID=867917 RepID=UPI000852D4A1|nr:alkaline phosphatase family protein [Vulcanisaeta thermophila]